MQLSSIEKDNDFKKLNSQLKEKNLYQILGIENNELVHSNMVAYLLGKNTDNNLSDKIRDSFLHDILKKSEIINLEDLDFINPKIYREKYNIDIIIEFNNLTLAIENKIFAGEGFEQLKRYQKKLNLYYPNYNKILVFLTPNGRKAKTTNKDSNIEVINYSYNQLLNLIEKAIKNEDNKQNDRIEKFIKHTREDIMGERKEVELCKEIYQKYPDTYKFMVDNFQEVRNSNIRKLFKILFNKVLNFSDENLEVDFNEPNRYGSKIYVLIDIRNKNWPEGIYIRIYKHHYLGIYPYLEKNYYNKALANSLTEEFEVNHLENDIDSKYYFTKSLILSKSPSSVRAINKDGEDITKKDVDKAFSRFKQYYNEINDRLININKSI
jgi:hypothetical protein